jgi:hypothetical protein
MVTNVLEESASSIFWLEHKAPSVLKMETASASETVTIYQTTQGHIPEDSKLHNERRESLISLEVH